MNKIALGVGIAIVIIAIIGVYGFSTYENNVLESTLVEITESTENPQTEGKQYTLTLSESVSTSDSP